MANYMDGMDGGKHNSDNIEASFTPKPKSLKDVLHKVSMTQIPENALVHGVVKALNGAECFKDTDEELGERIYTGDIFESVLSTNEEIPENSPLKITDKKTLNQLEELAELIDTEYVQIIMI
jgi:hypothetical protein